MSYGGLLEDRVLYLLLISSVGSPRLTFAHWQDEVACVSALAGSRSFSPVPSALEHALDLP